MRAGFAWPRSRVRVRGREWLGWEWMVGLGRLLRWAPSPFSFSIIISFPFLILFYCSYFYFPQVYPCIHVYIYMYIPLGWVH